MRIRWETRKLILLVLFPQIKNFGEVMEVSMVVIGISENNYNSNISDSNICGESTAILTVLTLVYVLIAMTVKAKVMKLRMVTVVRVETLVILLLT